jgi:hypothetical protein
LDVQVNSRFGEKELGGLCASLRSLRPNEADAECAKELGERKTNLNAIIEVGKVWNGKSLSGEVERHR